MVFAQFLRELTPRCNSPQRITKNAPAKDNKTRKYSTAEIPPTLQEPCFFADDGDPSAYTGGEGVNRNGYWGEKASVRDAESGKNTTVVDIASGEFKQEPGTKYITSTLYDYYTDYELNGLNRDTVPGQLHEFPARVRHF